MTTFLHASIYILFLLLLHTTEGTTFHIHEHITKRWKFGADPEQFMNTAEIITYHGYPVEEYNVTTEDGYILTIQRIPHGVNKHKREHHLPVLLMPGMGCTSVIWVFNVPDKNLAYKLADTGHDVWLGNFRGSTYGLNHANITTDDYSFWNFSFHEMGYYDVPAITDFILQKSGVKQINYAGIAMGCTLALVTLSTRLEYNNKIRLAVLFGPAAGLTYMSSIWHYFALAEPYLSLNPTEQLTMSPITRAIYSNICAMPAFYKLCKFGVYFSEGFNDENTFNMSRLSVYLAHFPDSTSSNMNFLHYTQIMKDGFRMYDFGEIKNHIAYGKATPPEYKLSQITSTIALFWNEADTSTTTLDVQYLFTQLDGHAINCEMPGKFTHGGYIVRTDADTMVYNKVIKLFDDDAYISNRTC